MELRHLRYFQAVAKAFNDSIAARRPRIARFPSPQPLPLAMRPSLPPPLHPARNPHRNPDRKRHPTPHRHPTLHRSGSWSQRAVRESWWLRIHPFLATFIFVAIATASPVLARPPRFLDLASDTHRQVIVDREPGQYLGHPTTVLLEDGQTILCVYPRGHGKGAICLKRSPDGGRSWSPRLPVPDNWATSLETPTLHRVVDASGRKRLIVWSGLYPARIAVSDDDGQHWTPLAPAGDWGGIVVMSSLEPVRHSPGHYLAWFHDDGRFIRAYSAPDKPPVFRLYQVESADGGLSWSQPREIHAASRIHLCEPGVVRSPDGREIALLLRENSRNRNSHVIFSRDEGKSWSPPRELPTALTGDRHTARYTPDGRLFIAFRDTLKTSSTAGDWVAWIGRYEDITEGRDGQYRVRLMDNHHAWDCAYPGVEILPDGTLVTTTYGHWEKGQSPYIVSIRLRLDELDRQAAAPQP